MEIKGLQLISANRELVWEALNDPQVLQKCLPGCESVERLSDAEFKIVLLAVVGPLKIRFKGSLLMQDIDRPNSCHMVFEGQGGVAGFGKGTASVGLVDIPDGTELTYSANAQVGGKLAQVGSRLIDNVAKKITDDFFKAFRKSLSGDLDADVLPSKSKGNDGELKTVPSKNSASNNEIENISTNTPMVPAWWLFIAVLMGSIITVASANLMR